MKDPQTARGSRSFIITVADRLYADLYSTHESTCGSLSGCLHGGRGKCETCDTLGAYEAIRGIESPHDLEVPS